MVLFHELTCHGYYALSGEPFSITPGGWNYDEQYAKYHLNVELSGHLANMALEQRIIIPLEHKHFQDFVRY